MRYAIIDITTRLVTNITIWTGDAWAPPGGSIVQILPDDSPVSIGDIFDVGTGTFSTPS